MQAKTIELGGKTYQLEYTNRALCALEDLVDGVALATMASRKVNTFCRYMMWAALREHQPDVTLDQAGLLVDQYQRTHGGRDGLMVLVTELQAQAGLIPKEQDGAEKNA